MITPNLLLQSIVDGVLLGFLYSLMALGLSLIFGVMGIINFAHGDLIMIGAYLTWILAGYFMGEASLTTIVTVPIFFALGALTYLTLIRPILGREPLIQIAVTVGLGYVLQNIALMSFRAEPKACESMVLNWYISVGPVNLHVAKLFVAAVSVITVVLLHILLSRTWIGLSIRATSDNLYAARLVGIDTDRVYMVTTGIGFAIIALAAALWMTFGQVNPYLGRSFSLVSWVIVALAGLGGVKGVVASAIIIGLANSLTTTLYSASIQMAVAYIVFLLVLWFKPKGLFGG